MQELPLSRYAIAFFLILWIPGSAAAHGHRHGHSHGHDGGGLAGSAIVVSADCEDIGLGGLCSGPLYTVEKSFEVFSYRDPDNPAPVPHQYTYVYTLANDDDSNAFFGRIVRFELDVATNGATHAGFLDGGGVEPSSVEIAQKVVRWRFEVDTLDPGETSERLYVVSPFAPVETDDAMGSNASLFTPSTCPGPLVAPKAKPCSAVIWELREKGLRILRRLIPDEDYAAVRAAAVATSSVFDTVEELEDALTSHSFGAQARAERQLAALLLNLAHGTLFPERRHCVLYPGEHGTPVDLDRDGEPDATVSEALALIEEWILSGDEDLLHRAALLAFAINHLR